MLRDQAPMHDGQRAPGPALGAEQLREIVQRRLDENPGKMRLRRETVKEAEEAIARLPPVSSQPMSSASALRARHGLCATPPNASRASRMVPSSSRCRAAATETSAKAKLDRSRTLR